MALSSTTSVTFTRPSNTTAYTAGDVLGTSSSAIHTLSSVTSSDRWVYLQEVQLQIHENAVPSGMAGFRMHFYQTSPTAIADNASFNLVAADRTIWRGSIDLPAPTDLGDTIVSQVQYCGMILPLEAGSTSYYIQLQTLGGYTPSSGTVHLIRARFMEAGM